MKYKDEAGKKYGRLTVIERAGSNASGYALWRCKCDCGSECIARGDCLRSGQTKSCGCLRKEAINIVAHHGYRRTHIDETGNRYGRLTVIRRGGTSAQGTKWVCKCDCGNYVEVRGSALRRGLTRSCGCYRRERLAEAHGWTIREVGDNT